VFKSTHTLREKVKDELEKAWKEYFKQVPTTIGFVCAVILHGWSVVELMARNFASTESRASETCYTTLVAPGYQD
jgi:hypothetical protein